MTRPYRCRKKSFKRITQSTTNPKFICRLFADGEGLLWFMEAIFHVTRKNFVERPGFDGGGRIRLVECVTVNRDT